MRAISDQIVLAKEPDFRLGALAVSPAKCQVAVGAAVDLVQPRIMQVLVALAGQRGAVVSRDELMARCWGGFAVSDDAIHRCIARIRRLSESHGGFRVETVPRVGYQLIEECVLPAAMRPRSWRRRAEWAGLVAAGALLVAAGYIGGHFF